MSGIIIKDGTGTGYRAKVDESNRLEVHSVERSEAKEQTLQGDAFNLNTGEVTISAATAMLYVKNNDSKNLHVDAMAVGLGSGTYSGEILVEIIRNPTTGTTIDNTTAVSMKSNQNFGSSVTFDDVVAYKAAASGNTLTNGSNHAIFYMSSGAAPSSGRLFATFPWVLPQGSSIGVRVTPNATGVTCYVALIGYLKKPGT